MRYKPSDILENLVDQDVLTVLLLDRTTGTNIIWATDDYSELGEGYAFALPILIEQITNENGNVIKPRVEKDREAQAQRSKEMAEVFTPSWVCNIQNNLVDKAFIGAKFNTEKHSLEKGHYWEYEGKSKEPVFPRPNGITWIDYVKTLRMEISCGEAPYLTSRYDTVSGDYIKPSHRIGLLDRKLRVICRYAQNGEEWIEQAKEALKSIYGFEWQGDNVLLARENLLYSVLEFYDYWKRQKAKTGFVIETEMTKDVILECAEIISWNIWQMDGIKYVIPGTCHDVSNLQMDLFGETSAPSKCPGCKSGKKHEHNGIYSFVMDWEKGIPVKYLDISKGVS